MDSKAWIKIVEASLAIMIMMGAFLIIINYQKKNTGANEKDIHELQRNILEIVSKNEELRSEILLLTIPGDGAGLKLTDEETYQKVEKLAPAAWNFELRACNLEDICGKETWEADKEVYAEEILITSNLESYAPRKLKFFAWME